MKRIEQWPPPDDWYPVRISWRVMLDDPEYSPRGILDWIEQAPGGRWHLSGWDEWNRLGSHGVPHNRVDGFEFRFENQADAVMFALRWSQHGTE